MKPFTPTAPFEFRRAMAFFVAIFFGALVWLGADQPQAHAQSKAKLERALKKAQDQYDALQLDKADRGLRTAIKKAERAGFAEDPITARLYIFLGVVRHALSGEEDAREAFLEALIIDPDAQIPPDYQTPSLTSILESIRAEQGGGPNVVGPEIAHDPVETASAGEPTSYRASVPPHLPLYRVTLNFRRFGESAYKLKEMEPEGRTDFIATLKGGLVCSSQIDYYIEVLDRTNNVIVAAGSPNSPLTTFVFGGKNCDGSDIEIGNGNGGGGGGGGGDDEDRQYLFIQLVMGGGFGLATGTPLVNPDVGLNPGLAPAPLHLMTELGLILSDSFQLSGFMRAQFVLLQGGTQLEPLYGGKLRWSFGLVEDLSMYTAFGAGFGFVRHTVDLRPARDFTDTTRHGPFHGGLGFGLSYALSDNFALVIDVYAVVLFPTISAHTDGNAGLRVSF